MVGFFCSAIAHWIKSTIIHAPDFSIPLLHDVYPGNRHDANQFKVILAQLKARYETITRKTTDITLVFDRGNNSEENINRLESGEFKIHYVGGLRKCQVQDLFDYLPLESVEFKVQSAYRCQKKVFGRDATVLIIHNPKLEQGQIQGIY